MHAFLSETEIIASPEFQTRDAAVLWGFWSVIQEEDTAGLDSDKDEKES